MLTMVPFLVKYQVLVIVGSFVSNEEFVQWIKSGLSGFESSLQSSDSGGLAPLLGMVASH